MCFEAPGPELQRDRIEDILARVRAAQRRLGAVGLVASGEGVAINQAALHNQQILAQEALDCGAKLMLEPFALRSDKALLVLAPNDRGRERVLHRLAEDPLGPSVAQFPSRIERQQQIYQAIVQEG